MTLYYSLYYHNNLLGSGHALALLSLPDDGDVEAALGGRRAAALLHLGTAHLPSQSGVSIVVILTNQESVLSNYYLLRHLRTLLAGHIVTLLHGHVLDM